MRSKKQELKLKEYQILKLTLIASILLILLGIETKHCKMASLPTGVDTLATGATAGANSLFDFDPGIRTEIRTFISILVLSK